MDWTLVKSLLPNPEDYIVIETRGGFHLVVKNAQNATDHRWFPMILEEYPIDLEKHKRAEGSFREENKSDKRVPMVGTTQGDWPLKLLRYES